MEFENDQCSDFASKMFDFRKEPFVPLDHSGLFSFLTLSWMTPIFKKAVKRPLELVDFFTMSENDSGDLNGQR